MKKTKPTRPSRSEFSVLRQVCQLIPAYWVPRLARATGSDPKARTFTPWSHVVAMLYAQLPAENTLSHANKVRAHALAERLFWKMLEPLGQQSPGFGRAALGLKVEVRDRLRRGGTADANRRSCAAPVLRR